MLNNNIIDNSLLCRNETCRVYDRIFVNKKFDSLKKLIIFTLHLLQKQWERKRTTKEARSLVNFANHKNPENPVKHSGLLCKNETCLENVSLNISGTLDSPLLANDSWERLKRRLSTFKFSLISSWLWSKFKCVKLKKIQI